MKKNLTLTTFTFLFLGCSMQPNAPRVIYENAPITAPNSSSSTSSTHPSLGEVITGGPNIANMLPTPTPQVPTPPVRSVYEDVVPEDNIATFETSASEPTTTKESAMSVETGTEGNPTVETATESSKTATETTKDPYGNAPKNYRATIRKYLAKKEDPSATLKFVFSRPQKAKKNNGSWKGWMVQVDMLKRNGKGEVLKTQPYTILFNGSSIVEDIANDNPKNISKVIY